LISNFRFPVCCFSFSAPLRIKRDDVTVMGSSAPAPGITLNGEFADRVLAEKWSAACYPSGATRAVDIYTAGNVHAAGGPARGVYDVNEVGAAAPFEIEAPPIPVTIIPGADVPANVIADVGALPRDAHDEAFIHTYAGRGREVGGPPP
jgi:hypothetical protein